MKSLVQLALKPYFSMAYFPSPETQVSSTSATLFLRIFFPVIIEKKKKYFIGPFVSTGLFDGPDVTLLRRLTKQKTLYLGTLWKLGTPSILLGNFWILSMWSCMATALFFLRTIFPYLAHYGLRLQLSSKNIVQVVVILVCSSAPWPKFEKFSCLQIFISGGTGR